MAVLFSASTTDALLSTGRCHVCMQVQYVGAFVPLGLPRSPGGSSGGGMAMGAGAADRVVRLMDMQGLGGRRHGRYNLGTAARGRDAAMSRGAEGGKVREVKRA